MKVTPLLTFKNIEELHFVGIFKFVIISVNLFQNGRKFVLLGPGVKHVYHRDIILALLEENELTGEDVTVTTFGGGAFAFANPAKQYAPDEFAREQFSEERPFMLFDGKSYAFGETMEKYIREALTGDTMIESQILCKMVCGRGIQLQKDEFMKIKSYSIKELRELKV